VVGRATDSVMGADGLTDCWSVGGGIVARGCIENTVMTVGHGHTATVHGVDVISSEVSISHNAIG
jgi:hypothetical protein